MSPTDPQFLTVGAPGDSRSIALRHRPGRGPTVVWLGGFRSDMTATKAEAVDAWGAEQGRAVLRFDYSGHGASGGAFADGTIGRWLEDAQAAIDHAAGDRPLLVGSSMGGWIALLAAQRMLAAGRPAAGLVLIAPAADFTEELMWAQFPEAIRQQIMQTGLWERPSEYSPEPVPITRALIQDGRRHLVLTGPIVTGCPIHILQGMQDPDVPWRHALRLIEHLPGDEVVLTLIKDGDHRLSRPQDIARLLEAIGDMAV